ncbi:interleukin-26 [Camelus bactrianus]|uniref:Interleukin-26 n=1 Tax=Camelus bactrianus TaxID=9837 RepID=A0A9W3H384_CAMBA
MRVNCIMRSGLLFVTLSLAIAKLQQSSFAQSCYPRGTLSQAVDILYVKATWLKATIPEDRIKNIRLLKKKTKKLFMKNCRFQEQLLSFFMEDVFSQLQLQVCKEIDFVEDFHSLRQKLSRCVSMHSKYGLWWNKRPQMAATSIYGRKGVPVASCFSARLSKISCVSSAREMKSITRLKRTFYEIGNKGIYKAISELDILLSWIKQFLESIK